MSYLSLWKVLLMMAVLAPLARGGDAQPLDSRKSPEAPRPISFPFSYTGEGLANLSGGYRRGAVYEGLLNLGVQGDLDKLIGWQGGSFLVSSIYPHGPSLTDNYVHDFNAASNIDAYDTVRLYEAWVQQELADGKVSIRIGQILMDAEFFVSDHAALFINSAFGVLPVISQNFNAPIFPEAVPGMRVRWTASDSISLQAGVFQGNAGDQALNNFHGVDWQFGGNGGVVGIAEVAYKLNAGKESTGLPGTYKLGAFFHSAQDSDGFREETHCADGGGYMVADQQLWRKPGTEDQGLSGFLRIGGAPEDRNVVPFYFDTGFNFKGLLPGRDQDIAGLGFSYTKLSGDLVDDAGGPLASHHEAILEATYKIQVKDWLTVQPDFQYIFNPGACEDLPDAVVAGIRFNVTF